MPPMLMIIGPSNSPRLTLLTSWRHHARSSLSAIWAAPELGLHSVDALLAQNRVKLPPGACVVAKQNAPHVVIDCRITSKPSAAKKPDGLGSDQPGRARY